MVSPFASTLNLTFFLIVLSSDSEYPPVIDFTFTYTVAFFFSANLFTVIVTVVPSSTVFPPSTFCFNTTPLSLELFSS